MNKKVEIDYHKILGVDVDTPKNIVKQAYYKYAITNIPIKKDEYDPIKLNNILAIRKIVLETTKVDIDIIPNIINAIEDKPLSEANDENVSDMSVKDFTAVEISKQDNDISSPINANKDENIEKTIIITSIPNTHTDAIIQKSDNKYTDKPALQNAVTIQQKKSTKKIKKAIQTTTINPTSTVVSLKKTTLKNQHNLQKGDKNIQDAHKKDSNDLKDQNKKLEKQSTKLTNKTRTTSKLNERQELKDLLLNEKKLKNKNILLKKKKDIQYEPQKKSKNLKEAIEMLDIKKDNQLDIQKQNKSSKISQSKK